MTNTPPVRPKRGRDTPVGADALYRTERAILALYDKGLSTETIMARTGYSRAKVRYVIINFSGKPTPKMEDGIRAGTVALLAAIQASGGMHA